MNRKILAAFAAVLLAAVFFSSCKDSDPDLCWIGVDTLYVSGIAVESEASIIAAFDAYVAHVESTEDTFPQDATEIVYVASEYRQTWDGLRYWLIGYRAHLPERDQWLYREILYVDENGALVLPLGCI
jgi:hypothetical protein